MAAIVLAFKSTPNFDQKSAISIFVYIWYHMLLNHGVNKSQIEKYYNNNPSLFICKFY